MRPIPLAMRDELELLQRMKVCAVAHFGFGECEPKIEWDHVWIYAGRQINEPWAIIGVCSRHHRLKDSEWLVRDAIQRASLRLATSEDLARYPRRNWAQLKKSLGMEV